MGNNVTFSMPFISSNTGLNRANITTCPTLNTRTLFTDSSNSGVILLVVSKNISLHSRSALISWEITADSTRNIHARSKAGLSQILEYVRAEKVTIFIR